MNILLNRSWIAMVVLLMGLIGCAGTKSQDSTGEYIDDASITAKVKLGMAADKEVSALNIRVETTKGIVHLTGSADSIYEANKATEIAWNVPGVKSVTNDIRIN